jgi:hypothetical protein
MRGFWECAWGSLEGSTRSRSACVILEHPTAIQDRSSAAGNAKPFCNFAAYIARLKKSHRDSSGHYLPILATPQDGA